MHQFSRLTRLGAAVLTALICGLTLTDSRRAAAGNGNPNASREAEFKAKSLAMIPRFVGWPEGSFANRNSPFIIGILSSDESFVKLVTAAAEGKSIGPHPVVVRHRPAPRELRRCHLLFISDEAWSHKGLRAPLLRAVRDEPILTVGEGEGFVKAGGIARFKSEDLRVSLVVNEDAAKRSGLNISSKLLRLPFCTVVKDVETP